MARRLTVTTIAGLSLVVAAAVPAVAETVSAKRWAKSVCNAVADWSAAIDDALADSDTTATEPAAVQTTLLDALEHAESKTRTLLDKLEDAGTPRAKRGDEAAEAISTSYDDVLSAISAAHGEVESAPTTDAAAFVLIATAALTDVEDALIAVQDALAEETALRTSSLRKAFDQKACREL